MSLLVRNLSPPSRWQEREVSCCKNCIPHTHSVLQKARLTNQIHAVSSFMTTFGHKLQHPVSASPSPQPQEKVQAEPVASSSSQQFSSSPVREPSASSTRPRTRTEQSSSRPGSMIYQPPLMDTARDTLPELLPIFTFLNSHANKLYQEGYFLKLNDLDIGEFLL